MLIWASRILISSLTKMAVFLQMSEYAVAFIIMGIATSVPEIFLAISSSIGGIGELSFGNVLGANILNITLLIGLIAIFAGGIEASPTIKNNTSPMVVIIILPFLLSFDGRLDWLDGVLLIAVYFFYLSRMVGREHKFEKTRFKLSGSMSQPTEKEEVSYRIKKGMPLYIPYDTDVIKQVFVFLGAIVLLLAASFLIISASRSMAETLHLGLVSFGILIVAMGTTVPELVFGIRSVMLKHDEMTVGNAFGSVAVNSSLVLGIAALISPVHLNINPRFYFYAFFILASFALLKYLLKGEKIAITKKEGLILILVYVLFAVINTLI